jgi:hypothetical protein
MKSVKNIIKVRTVKSFTLQRFAWVVGFISLEQTSSLEVPFENE